MERLFDLNEIELDTRLQLLRFHDRFQLVTTCRCGHSGAFDLAKIKDWRFCARWLLERGRCQVCGKRGDLTHLRLEHAGWKHQPIETRLLWAGEPVQQKATVRGTLAQIEAAQRYAAEKIKRQSVKP